MDDKDYSTFKIRSDDKMEILTKQHYDHERRISGLEIKMEVITTDVNNLNLSTQKIEDSLDTLINQSANATGYLKGIVWAVSIFGALLTGLNAMGYLKLPRADSDKQEVSSTKLKE